MKEPLWASQEILATVGAKSDRPWYADGLQVDSRDIIVGDLFIAMRGARQDGHDFVGDALKRGAVAVLAEKKTYIEGYDSDPRVVRVDDTRKALHCLARGARTRAPAKVMAVTGSAGKTSMVRALGKVFERSDSTHTSIKSFNNHMGVPLSMARMPRHTRVAVFEVGTGGPGEIEPLSQLVQPDVAIVTSVGAAHRAAFADEAAIAREKASLVSGLAKGGVAILGMDHGQADTLKASVDSMKVDHLTVAIDGRADVSVIKLAQQEGCSCLTADVAGTSVTFKVGIPGRAWVMNSLLVLAATKAIGGDLGQAAMTLAGLSPPEGRGRVAEIQVSEGLIRLIDDSYNANPLSMRAALERLSLLSPKGRGRRVALIGDMLELGDTAEDFHHRLGQEMADAGVEWVISHGPLAHIAGETAGVQHTPLNSLEDAAALVHHGCRAGDILMVKGSNASGLGSLVQTLLESNRANQSAEIGHGNSRLFGWENRLAKEA